MHLLLNRKLAISQRIPQLDRLIARSRYDLSIISGKGDGEDVVVVADEAARGGSCGEFP